MADGQESEQDIIAASPGTRVPDDLLPETQLQEIENRPIRSYRSFGAVGIAFSIIFGIGFIVMFLTSTVSAKEPITTAVAAIVSTVFFSGFGVYSFDMYRREIVLTPQAIESNGPLGNRRIAFADVDRLTLCDYYGNGEEVCKILAGKRKIQMRSQAAQYAPIVTYVQAHVSPAAIEAGRDTSKEVKTLRTQMMVMTIAMTAIFCLSRVVPLLQQEQRSLHSGHHYSTRSYQGVAIFVVLAAWSIWTQAKRLKRP
jgi:hypothetical protein